MQIFGAIRASDAAAVKSRENGASASPAEPLGIQVYQSDEERAARGDLLAALRNAPIPQEQLLSNLGLFLESKSLARILFMDFLFRQIVDVPGVVMELGTRWGQNAALFAALRGIHDPFNRHRKIVVFDTFAGFPAIHENDGVADMIDEAVAFYEQITVAGGTDDAV